MKVVWSIRSVRKAGPKVHCGLAFLLVMAFDGVLLQVSWNEL